ncbi:TIGR01244 family sulfur transferase [Pontixanthobacter aestiaquae]|uniref:TIGR01244 family phosphatase n=1 Tax=Pontixanthobacter aestiaquae TaxID=1509367 RepID=A0A844Z4D1_9SPHN|nr:TIGR01244 family sulfur transferase [Pontixanthobacter aestiaquae]MDN3647065.1 TIGR01244 family sulfur transferase [Pontixanthobacter aestiaquae]MXO81957.1 TIGR01244 family phosphatase [Pontixanthobacter aestiaquae]
MSDFRRLSDSVLASPQIGTDDIAEAKKLGVTLIINNRPEGESPDQTEGARIEQAAREAGLDYFAIPIGQAGFGKADIEAMSGAFMQAGGQVLAYCRSGTRSTFLWSLAEASQGGDPDELTAAAAQAGYDLSPIRPMLEALAGEAS